ncbi:hypothetical protein V3C99_004325, partial [Haemonchus contortus]
RSQDVHRMAFMLTACPLSTDQANNMKILNYFGSTCFICYPSESL